LYRTLLLNKKGYETPYVIPKRGYNQIPKRTKTAKFVPVWWYKYIRENIAYFTRSFFWKLVCFSFRVNHECKQCVSNRIAFRILLPTTITWKSPYFQARVI